MVLFSTKLLSKHDFLGQLRTSISYDNEPNIYIVIFSRRT